MSVNLSARQLIAADLVDTVAGVLSTTRILPEQLTLEVTETAVIADTHRSAIVLGELRALGVRIAVDDFGVGGSSLARLQTLPIDILKIDKSFIDHVPDGQFATALLDSIVGVANALGLSTVVEGVERRDQVAHVRAAGFHRVQGYYFARPLEAHQILAALVRGGLDAPIGSEAVSIAYGAAAGDWARPSALVVDDDGALGSVVCRVLEGAGFEATTVSSCVLARQSLHTSFADAVVIDIGLPDGSGWSLVAQLRATQEYARVPIVVMTGLADTADVLTKARSLGCEYLGKPFAPEALLAKLENARLLMGTRVSRIPVVHV